MKRFPSCSLICHLHSKYGTVLGASQASPSLVDYNIKHGCEIKEIENLQAFFLGIIMGVVVAPGSLCPFVFTCTSGSACHVIRHTSCSEGYEEQGKHSIKVLVTWGDQEESSGM